MQKEKDRTERLDHTGLVAGMIDELDLVRMIDEECVGQAKNKWLTFGPAYIYSLAALNFVLLHDKQLIDEHLSLMLSWFLSLLFSLKYRASIFAHWSDAGSL